MTQPRNDGNTAAKDEARTPPEIFRKLDAEFHFELDAACTRDNCLCESGIFHDEGKDALVERWVIYPNDNTYCNPPYSNGNILKFVHKAWHESGNGATVVLLIQADTSTEYFKFCFECASEIRFMIPRIKFNNPDGTPMKGSPVRESMIVVFRPGDNGGMAKVRLWRWK